MVWLDINNNGIVDGSESGIDGVTVHLVNGTGLIVSSQITSSGGYYLFTDLAAGSYKVVVVTTGQYRSSTGANAAVTGPFEPAPAVQTNSSDSDDNGTTVGSIVESSVFTLGAGQPTGEPSTPGHSDAVTDGNGNYTVDFGMYLPASLGDTVWFDDNHNGAQDVGEAGVSGVIVNLLDVYGVLVATTTTDSAGHYGFTNLAPGSYSVEFVKNSLPTGFDFTTVGGGTSLTDSDADPQTGRSAPVVLAAGENNPTIDAGIHHVVTPTTTTIFTQLTPVTTTTPPAPASSTTLPRDTPTSAPVSGQPSPTTVTTAAPSVTTIPVSTGSVIGSVWKDRNGNGVREGNERGVAKAIVVLTASDGSTRRTTTAEDGSYRFDGVPPGVYQVEILATTTPTNGPRSRSVVIAANQVSQDFGFSNSGVEGITAQNDDGLAFTGSSSLLLLALALTLLGLGAHVALPRRRRSATR